MLALSHISDSSSSQDFTMAVLGCGTMGIAILGGILSSLSEIHGPKPLQTPSGGTATPTEDIPSRLPSRFIASVRCPESAKRVKGTLWEHSSVLKVVRNGNVSAAQQSEVVLLTCKPSMVKTILGEPGMAKALQGKLLISVCDGVTVEDMEVALHGAVPPKDPSEDGRCRIVRAMCNTAALIRESMTVIATTERPLPDDVDTLVTWIFKRVGDVVHLPTSNMDASAALCGAGPAFFALMLEAAVDGGVAMGLPRNEAIRIATQTMRGTTGLVQHGEHPAILREKVCAPGSCAISGVMVLEEGTTRGTISRAIRESATTASQLSRDMKPVSRAGFNSSPLPYHPQRSQTYAGP